MEIIKFSDLLNACYEFREDPTNTEKEYALQDLLNKLVVKTYQPILKKEMAVISILSACKREESEADLAIDIEVGKIYYGLLPYAVNLMLDLELDSFVYPFVDLLYETEVVDKIEEFCKKDYERIEKMLDRAINFSNIDRIVQIPAFVSDDKLTEVINTIKDFKNDISPEALKAINALAVETSPEWRAFKETIADKIHSDINEQLLWEAENKHKQKEEVLDEKNEQESDNTESTDKKGPIKFNFKNNKK